MQPIRPLRTSAIQQAETAFLLLPNPLFPFETADRAFQDPGGRGHRTLVPQDNRLHVGNDQSQPGPVQTVQLYSARVGGG
jgi:hypothetical protein